MKPNISRVFECLLGCLLTERLRQRYRSTQPTNFGHSRSFVRQSARNRVIKVKGNKEFKIYHTTYLENKTWGTRQWFDHPVTDMRICMTDGFEKKDCKVVNSDTANIPEGMSLHNLSIDFKYSESGRSFTKNVTVAKDAKPE
jgi:hypothetical protein